MSMRFHVQQQIDASPVLVFRTLTDLRNAGRWMRALVRIKPMTNGPLRVGSRWRETRRMLGREVLEEIEVTEMEPPERLVLRMDGSRGTSKRGEFLFHYRLVPDDGGTRVELDGEIRETGPLMEWLGKVLVEPYRKAAAADLETLAGYLKGMGRELTTRAGPPVR